MTFAPSESDTGFVVALLVATPATVQEVSPGMVVEPSTVKATLIDVAVVSVPSAGEVIATITGGTVRVTLIELVAEVAGLEQVTEIVLDPIERLTLFVAVLVDAAPLTVQVESDGIEAAPLTV